MVLITNMENHMTDQELAPCIEEQDEKGSVDWWNGLGIQSLARKMMVYAAIFGILCGITLPHAGYLEYL